MNNFYLVEWITTFVSLSQGWELDISKRLFGVPGSSGNDMQHWDEAFREGPPHRISIPIFTSGHLLGGYA